MPVGDSNASAADPPHFALFHPYREHKITLIMWALKTGKKEIRIGGKKIILRDDNGAVVERKRTKMMRRPRERARKRKRDRARERNREERRRAREREREPEPEPERG